MIDVTNDGTDGTPTHPGCPCFGDQPLIGADAHAFWVSTNEFPMFQRPASMAPRSTRSISWRWRQEALPILSTSSQGGPLAEGISYSVQPATIPPGGSYASVNNGTQYFLSALEFFGGLDNRIAIWAATNTASIHTAPAISIQNGSSNTIVYGQPPEAQQPNIAVGHICDPTLFMVVGCGLLNGTLLGVAVQHSCAARRQQRRSDAAGHVRRRQVVEHGHHGRQDPQRSDPHGGGVVRDDARMECAAT